LQTCEKNKTWFSLLLNAGGTPLAAASFCVADFFHDVLSN